MKSLLFIYNFVPGSETGIVWASWTIGVEMVFYAIFPLLFLRYRNGPGLIALLFATLLIAVVYHEFVLHLALPPAAAEQFYSFSFFRSLPCFIIGMLCWLIYDRYIDGREHRAELGAALILASLWAFHALLQQSLTFWFPDGYYWQAIIYSTLLLGVGIKPVSFFVNRLTRFAGKVSYSIYLLHPSTILFLFPVYGWIYGAGFPLTVSFLACYAVTLAVVISLAAITFRWIERPGMRLGKRLIERLSTRDSSLLCEFPRRLPSDTRRLRLGTWPSCGSGPWRRIAKVDHRVASREFATTSSSRAATQRRAVERLVAWAVRPIKAGPARMPR